MVPDQHDRSKSLKSCQCASRSRCKSLLHRRKKSHPPFNSGVPVHVKLGLHPKLAIYSSDAPPPGSYDPEKDHRRCSHVSDWKKEEASEEFAATMGGRFLDNFFLERELMKSGRGPGTHEIKQWPEVALEKSCTPQNRDTGFGVTSRFKSSHVSGTPGPGYTGKEHNPYFYLDNKTLQPTSQLQTFEFDGLAPRFKKPFGNWFLPCNRYNAKDPDCLDNILKKVTSRRGPYDLFTGPRNSSTLFGYLTQPESIDTDNWPMKFSTEFEKAYSGCNSYRGVWTDCPRFTKKPTVRSMLEDISLCYKDPDSPGPGSYDPAPTPKSVTQMMHPFNDSVKNTRPLRKFEISPGPATYDVISYRKRIPGNGWTSTFKSKVQRRIGPKPDQYNSF